MLSEQQNQDDERAALECSLIKEDLEALGGRPRWVPHDTADALAKAKGAHFTPMARLLNTSKFSIKDESEELLDRKGVKEGLGYVPRPRTAPERSGGGGAPERRRVRARAQPSVQAKDGESIMLDEMC